MLAISTKQNKIMTIACAIGLLTGISLAQLGAKPICNYKIQLNKEQSNSGTNCSEYSVCTVEYECVEGDRYKDCGTPVSDFPAYCTNYIGGTWNNVTQQCEDGLAQMPFTYNGDVNGYDYPTFCDPGNH